MPWSGNNKERKIFHNLKLISPVFHSHFRLSNPKELLDLQLPVHIRVCMQHPQASHGAPGKSSCLRSALYPPPDTLEQLTACNKEIFFWSITTLNITSTLKRNVLKYPTDFVMGFPPRPPRVLSPCPNGHKLLQLSPEDGLNSVFLSPSEIGCNSWTWGKIRKFEQVPHPVSTLWQ